MIKRVETNLYKSEAIKEDINNAVGIAESADATAGTALSRVTYEYGVCTDSSDKQNKVVAIENFPELYVGATCTVTFRNRNTAQSPTLNVNGTGAKTIYARGSGLSARSGYNWENGAVLRFIYDGTYWVMMPQSMQEAVNVLAGSNENSQTQIMYVEQGRVYINADYITTGSLDASIIATTELNASNIVTGTLDAERLTVINLRADSITGGTLDFDDIAVRNLTATDIVGGTLSLGGATNGEIVVKDAQNRTIATLDTNGLTLNKGVIDANKVEVKNIDAEKITAGTLSVDRIPNLDADKITTGYLDAARIQADSIDVSKLGGEISNGQWKLDFENETFTIGTITAESIASGTLTLGGRNNQEGELVVKNAAGGVIGKWNNEGINVTSGTISGSAISGGTISSSVFKSTGSAGAYTYSLELSSGVVTMKQNNTNFVLMSPAYGGIRVYDIDGSFAVLSGGRLNFTDSSSTITLGGATEYAEAKVGGRITTAQYTADVANTNATNALGYARRTSSSTEQFRSGPFTCAINDTKKVIYVWLPSARVLPGNNKTLAENRITVSGNVAIRSSSGGLRTYAQSTFTWTATEFPHGITLIGTRTTALDGVEADSVASFQMATGSGYIDIIV